MKFSSNILTVFALCLIGVGCVQTAPEEKSNGGAITSKSGSSTTKSFVMTRPNGTFNLVATKSVNAKGLVVDNESIKTVKVSSTGYSISMGVDEFASRGYTVSVPVPRDGDQVQVVLLDSENVVIDTVAL